MRRAVLIVMLDVMVLSVLALNAGKGSSRLLVPAHRWSQVIAEGLQKELEMESVMAKMAAELAKAEEEALKAQDLARLTLEREAELRKSADALRGEHDSTREALEATRREREAAKAREALAEERARHERELAETARKREEEARRRETDALAREQDSLGRQREAERLAREAEASAREAVKRVGDAVARSAEAETLATAAERRASEALAAEKEAIARAAKARDAARSLEVTAASASATAKKAEQSEEHLKALSRDMQAQIRETMDRVELAMVREGAALERARLAESERERLDAEKAESMERITELRESLGSVALKEKHSAERLEDARKRLEEYQKQVESQAAERTGSVWVQREQALRLLQVVMVETEPGRAPFTRRMGLFMPKVRMGDRVVVPAEFESLGFGLWWYQSKVDRFVSRLAFALGPVPGAGNSEEQTHLVRQSLLFTKAEPRVCLVQVDGTDAAEALEIAGMTAIKQERIQHALLFKRDAPDRRVKVEITPSVSSALLVVRNAEPSAKTKLESGDYILTEDGRFVGVMVSESECYALPKAFPAKSDRLDVPLTKPPQEKYYSSFVKALADVRKLVKKQNKQRGTRQ